MIYHSYLKAKCTRCNDLRGSVQRMDVKTSIEGTRRVNLVFCAFYDGATECKVCVSKLMNFLDNAEIHYPDIVLDTEELPSP